MAKKNVDIDIEEILLRQVAQRNEVQDKTNEVPSATEPEKNARVSGPQTTLPHKESLYEEIFLREKPVQLRSMIYIRADTKRKLMQVAHRLGWSKVSVTAYADNILSNHLEVFREEINRLHRLKNTKEII